MKLQSLAFFVGSCLLFGQRSLASEDSESTGSTCDITVEDVGSKLVHLLSAKLTKLEEDAKIDRDSLKALSEKMDNRDESIEAELVSYKEITKLNFDSMKDTLASVNNKTSSIEDAIKDYAGKEALCGYRRLVNSTSQTITFDRVYVEVNDHGGYFNPQTGIFTAGAAGVYEVSVSIGMASTIHNCIIDIRLKTSSGRYWANNENRIFYLSFGSQRNYTPMSGSRFMFLDENKSIYLDYKTKGNQCGLNYIKMCIAFYSKKGSPRRVITGKWPLGIGVINENN